jgi:diacylglycerol kinase family enzyme
MLFAALRADDSRADEGLADVGNGFIWTNEELSEYFPALAQMPLGSANDFAHTLGWGQKFPGCRECFLQLSWRKHALGALHDWLEAVLRHSSHVTNFDVYGIVPEEGANVCNFKLAELTGPRGFTPKVTVDGKKQILMKEAGLPVPLFTCLYFSAGFGAYMTARFQMNRRKGPMRNKMEYAKQAAGILVESIPPQLNVGLDGVQITAGGMHYFPPHIENGRGGDSYREVGFLNINWQAGMVNGRDRASVFGRLFTSREPAKFNDGKMDMYRAKFGSLLRNPGLKYQTDKKDEGLTLTYSGGKGKGVFFQWDGESRFAFSPSGQPFHIHIRKILSIPVVLGPKYNANITGNPGNGQKVMFRFGGNTPKEEERFRERIVKGVRGELNAELTASREELLAAGFPMENSGGTR